MSAMSKLYMFFCLIAVCFLANVASADYSPSFCKAQPVWPKGQTKEMNTFYGFRATFDAKETDCPTLRITGCSDYRISLNGEHIGWGPARAAKGYFRIDEIPLSVKPGRNILAVEVAGYYAKSYYHMEQPSFLQAEIVLDGDVLAATGVDGNFSARKLPRLQKTARYSGQRTFTEAYRLTPGVDDWKFGKGEFLAVDLEQCPAVKYLPRRTPYADFRINGSFRLVSEAKTQKDGKKKIEPFSPIDDAGAIGRSGFPKNKLDVNLWADIQRIVATNRVVAPAGDGRRNFRLDATESLMFDAGLNDTGFVGFRVKCEKPGTIVVKFDEILMDGEVSPTRYKCANAIAWEFTEPGVYTVESFEPYTLKYVDVIAQNGSFEISSPYMRTFKNPKSRRAKLVCSDAAVEKIFEAARETYAQNAVDVFTDCPGRERAGWLCDSFFTGRSSILFTGSVESEHLFLENYLLPERFGDIPEGMFPMCYPADFGTGNFIPNWAMWLVLELE